MPGHLSGKVALVTGGGSAREGARVMVADMVATGSAETVARIQQAAGEATFVQTDVSQATEVEALMAAIVATYGRLDCARNNAGIEGVAAFTADYPEADWDCVIAVNPQGVWLCLKYKVSQMQRQGGGLLCTQRPWLAWSAPTVYRPTWPASTVW